MSLYEELTLARTKETASYSENLLSYTASIMKDLFEKSLKKTISEVNHTKSRFATCEVMITKDIMRDIRKYRNVATTNQDFSDIILLASTRLIVSFGFVPESYYIYVSLNSRDSARVTITI